MKLLQQLLLLHLLGIKIIHLHGGETTLGCFDDKLRNAITQLSSIHFTSAEVQTKSSKYDFSKNNTFNVGPLSIDGLLNLKTISKKQFEEKTGLHIIQKLFQDFGFTGLTIY